MDSKSLLVVLLVLVCCMHSVWSQTTESTTKQTSEAEITTEISPTTEPPFYNCRLYEGSKLDLDPLVGLWYETGQYPFNYMKCSNISVDDKVSTENKIELQFEYVDSSDDKWESAKKSSSYPWNSKTQNGIFEKNVEETYKLVRTDRITYAFFCGYVGTNPVDRFKVWTRQRHLTSEEMMDLQIKFVELGQGTNIVWVEQSLEKCNSAMRTAGGSLVALALALLVYRRNI
ncbi:uncharacterized protein LOC6560845 [Drosophila grimshawi]|uniref:GH20983 n=1 Tax=Drosophila grimshawi TaxID=7222 RepID=B4J4T4_DROGR|nr:uncharacterized protein LOC6560845 [Drosophila grimshawi]EDW00630.1 GH20983 [Drosophila grimshawi]